MKLQQISAQDTVTQQLVKKMVESAKIFEYLEFFQMPGNAGYLRKASTASGGRWRALNSNYPANVVSPSFANPVLKIFGDKVEVDKAHERRGYDVASVRAREALNFVAQMAKQFQNYFINGYTEDNSDGFDGLKFIIPSAQKITAATNGLTVTVGNDNAARTAQQKFVELINQLITSLDGGAQLLMMDGKTLSRLSTIARDQCQTVVDDFGKPVLYFNGIPILDSGYDNAGNRVLPHDEVVGTSGAVCTSIYAMKFGEAENLSAATNVGLVSNDLGLVGVHYVQAIELDATLTLLNNKAAGRLEGLIIS